MPLISPLMPVPQIILIADRLSSAVFRRVQVIIALSESRRQHIPYRNSMMTSVLRDSLGGNCMTTMIANCSIDRPNVDVGSFCLCCFLEREGGRERQTERQRERRRN